MNSTTKLKAAKARLEKDISALEAAKSNLSKQVEACKEHLSQFGNVTRQSVYEREEIARQRKSLSNLEDYFIDEPALIPENRNAWKALTKELWANFKKIEGWLGVSA